MSTIQLLFCVGEARHVMIAESAVELGERGRTGGLRGLLRYTIRRAQYPEEELWHMGDATAPRYSLLVEGALRV